MWPEMVALRTSNGGLMPDERVDMARLTEVAAIVFL
jgi:hypothetical protein